MSAATGLDTPSYDSILVVGFGGPEKKDDVLPFLDNVLAGKRVPRERLLQVAEHYYRFDGCSPINEQVRQLLACLKPALQERGISLPVYWGNRNWHPMLADTVRKMADDGCRRSLALVLAAYSSYSSCRQYLENIADACRGVGDEAPVIDKIRPFYNHPGFVAANAAHLKEAIEQLPASVREQAHVVFTAHSIPERMATTCDYAAQLEEVCGLVMEQAGVRQVWSLAYQSRSGRPDDPWLAPDIVDHLEALADKEVQAVVTHPVGFLSDHMEVVYDLDMEAAEAARRLKIHWQRAATAGTHPAFVKGLVDLVSERVAGADRKAVGRQPARPDRCATDCCSYTIRQPAGPQ